MLDSEWEQGVLWWEPDTHGPRHNYFQRVLSMCNRYDNLWRNIQHMMLEDMFEEAESLPKYNDNLRWHPIFKE